MKLQNRTAVITGASSGIGKAIALELARNGCNVAIAARRADRLADTASECREHSVDVFVRRTDVTSRDDCFGLIEEVEEQFAPVDILINNAGFALLDRIESADIEDVRRMVETNIFGMFHCIQAQLPYMIGRGSGAIVNVSSIAGLMGYAGMGMYGATKFAVTGMTEALRDEVTDRGIEVLLVCPGTTESEFFLYAERGKIPAASRIVRGLAPEDVARATCRAIERGSYRTIVPRTAAAFIRFKELAPRPAHWLMRKVSAMLERRKS